MIEGDALLGESVFKTPGAWRARRAEKERMCFFNCYDVYGCFSWFVLLFFNCNIWMGLVENLIDDIYWVKIKIEWLIKCNLIVNKF